MGILYHLRIKSIVAADGMATHILSRQGQSARLWQQCSGTGAVICWWTLHHTEQRSTQVPTAQLYGSYLSNQTADFFEGGFQNSVLRSDKCINKLLNYVGK
ncbi:hypothetical protein TNCV_1925491 [Trichonephila clavipes]|nr:hypothetical protein TNCV_1925491 [Trichonephila clavipes]